MNRKKDARSYRAAEFATEQKDIGDGKTATIVRATVSSEAPYRRLMFDEEAGQTVPCYEVLGHAEGEIDTSRMADGLVIQDTHFGDQIGIIRQPEIKDGKIGGVIEFGCGERAQEIAADAAAGIRRNMSVGYIVNAYRKDGEAEDGLPIFRVTSWTPYEASFVNVPADTAVGVGRREEDTTTPPADEAAIKMKGIQKMDTEVKGGFTAAEKQKIRELASSAHVSGEEVADILCGERSFEEIREELLNRREAYLKELAAKPATPVESAHAELDESCKREIAKHYSLTNVIRYLTDMADNKASAVDIGFEREISAELASKTGRAVQGILLPDFVRAANEDGGLTLGTPDFSSTENTLGNSVSGSGNKTIATNLLAGNFIEALVDALVLRGRLGAEVLTGLVGNIAIPKGGSVSGGWVTEGSNVPKKNPTFGQITATPHTYGAYVDITRKLLLQPSVNVQAKILEWLMYACAKGLETAAFQGSGSDGQPTGVVTATTASARAKAWSNTPTFDKVVELIAAMRSANSYNPSMRFVGDAGVWAKLASTRDFEVVQNAAGTDNVGAIGGAARLLDIATDKVLGREFVESHCMPAKTLLFGDFSQLALCLWSGTDIIVDPYANDTAGGLRIVALQDSDVLIKTPEAFCKATGVHS